MLALCLNASIKDYDIKPTYMKSSKFMSIKILDSKELNFKSTRELSDIALDRNTLYAIGDKGYLYTFKISLKDNKIKKLKLKSETKLKNSKGKDLKKSKSDSEGLAFMGNDLLISFEKKSRIELYTKGGIKIKSIKIAKALQNIKNYRAKNRGLEAVTYSDKYGVITAPEVPLNSNNKRVHVIYSKNRTWSFSASGSITSLEFINSDEILILQRESKKNHNYDITLTKLNLTTCKSEEIAILKSKKGWKTDNFEGLTKVSKNKFLMISDNQNSKHQKTLLVLFELLK